ncbi:MAG: hypothetical protein R3B84_12800 [Zavarzinella sp.]
MLPLFNWLLPSKCPCNPFQKMWVEDRLNWLCDEFDDNIFNGRTLILPTMEFFPDPIERTERGAEKLFQQVCGYMDVQPELIDLDFVDTSNYVYFVNDNGQDLPAVTGSFSDVNGRYQIRLDLKQLDNPMEMVGSMARELANVRLLGDGRCDADRFDYEMLADLTVVFLGVGIPLANVTRPWAGTPTCWPGTRVLKTEHMTDSMFGYALAHLAWFQNETQPTWAQTLYWNARIELFNGVRFLRNYGDSSFQY